MKPFNYQTSLKAISRVATVVIIVVILIIAGAGIYFATLKTSSPTTTSSTPTTGTTPTSSSTTSGVPSTSSSTTGSTAPGTTLSIDDYVWPTYQLNQLYAFEYVPYPDWLEGDVYQTLVTVNLTAEQNLGQFGTNVFQQGLATSWNASSNGQVYTFNLRPGVTFTDGNSFNAYTVWTEFYTWFYLTNYSSTFWNGVNIFNTTGLNININTIGSDINSSGLNSPSSALVTMMSNTSLPAYVTSPTTINFQMTIPFSYLVNSFTGFEGMIWDPTFMFAHGGPGQPGNPNAYFLLNPIPGTGPYEVTAATYQSSVQFTQNPHYWGANLTAAQVAANPVLDPGHYKNVIVYDISSETTSYLNLQSGTATSGVQIASVSGSDFQTVAADKSTYGFALIQHPATNVWMWMNNQIFPTNITLVRQAIVHAINYTDVIQAAAYGYGTPMMGPEAPYYGQYYDPGNYAPYQTNITLAEADLKAAGYANGTGIPALNDYVDQLGTFWMNPAALVIKADLAVIGITVNIVTVPDSTYYKYYGGYSTNLANAANIPPLAMGNVAGFSPDYLAPTDFWVSFVTNSSLWGNFGIFNNATVDKDVYVLSHSNNQADILSNLTQAQGVIYQQAPYAWLFAAELPTIQGTYAYKTSIIKSFYLDPNLIGVDDIPIFNTVIPA